jgi:hypothetical protein
MQYLTFSDTFVRYSLFMMIGTRPRDRRRFSGAGWLDADGWMDDSLRFLLPASMRDAAIVVTAAVIIYTATIL